MADAISGLHHVTAIASSPQENIDFYVKSLRRRLVKQTVNFDEPGAYHLYYGDTVGTPGTILTFFPFVDAGPGRAGVGMASAVTMAGYPGGIGEAAERLSERGLDFDGPFDRFGDSVIAFRDPEGMPLEIVEHGDRPTPGYGTLCGVTLLVDEIEPSASVLTDLLGLSPIGEEPDALGERHRFRLGDGGSVDLVRPTTSHLGRPGAGTIHHVAFRAPDHESHLVWRQKVADFGLEVTPVIDRQYFDAIYFREPGGVLFEVATDPPGFAVDEPFETLGQALKLPPRYEADRARIERTLPPVKVPA